ncbi:MAG: hypothetical protein H0U10_14485, partial [Chloroflexia bacterium]|nr:hypothetical protein [Chloroflexia bacterium]
TGPGAYQLRIAAPEPGAYRLDLRQGDGAEAVTEATGFAILPSPELRPATGGDDLLRALAERTGGRVLDLDDPSAAFAASDVGGEPLREYRPVWFAPLALALALFLAEVAVRMGALGSLRARLEARS